MNTATALGDDIVVYRSDRMVGSRMSLDDARANLRSGLPGVLASHIAAFHPGAVVEFWTAQGGRRWVANLTADLEGSPLEHFQKRARPITTYIPDAPCGDCRGPDREDIDPDDDDPDDDEDGRMTFFDVHINAQDIIAPRAILRIRAYDHDDAKRRVLENWGDYEEECYENAMESVEIQCQDVEFSGDEDMIDDILMSEH
ncbi:hypothetical protein EOD42_14405 [Rhodovarius crocodyli]|uniref:Uncharacterized protein n=1 Tax=Rhodovarius crocodyli TaxID=1979269 RepID=A0A437MFA0_9PROT|nr:hypothetical protein [Rhodovarius crocodyli]RVT96299.1 hypothetical protein EOD42_14405 [Rhodovarius crocodyli]